MHILIHIIIIIYYFILKILLFLTVSLFGFINEVLILDRSNLHYN